MTLMNNMELESIKKETKSGPGRLASDVVIRTLPIEDKVQTLQVDYALPGRDQLTLDSSSPNRKVDNAQLAVLGDVFKLESTIAYVVLVDKETKVRAIEGVEKLRAEGRETPKTRSRGKSFNTRSTPTGSRPGLSKNSAVCQTSWCALLNPGSVPRYSTSMARLLPFVRSTSIEAPSKRGQGPREDQFQGLRGQI